MSVIRTTYFHDETGITLIEVCIGPICKIKSGNRLSLIKTRKELIKEIEDETRNN